MYKNYSTEELINAYTTMIEYSGKATDTMLSAIEERGGIESFKAQIELQKSGRLEINRITKEVYSLSSSETNVEFIKKLITSDFLSREELDKLIEIRFLKHQAFLQNKAITSKTIIGGLAGAVISCIIGAIAWGFLMIYMTPMFFYFYIIVVYIINYLIIKFITKQSRSNLAVFIITFFATIGSILLCLYFTSLLFPSG
jgi:hypothetical protein